MPNELMKTLTVGANTYDLPQKTSDLTNDSGFITSETDPTVPSWAKASSKPTYTKSEVGLGNVDNVQQYSASNPPPYPVTSVNGDTGAVTVSVPTNVSDLTNDSGFITSITADDTYVPKTKTQNYHTNSITYNSGQYSSNIIIKSDGFSNQAGIGVYANDNGYPNATIFVGDISSTNTFITGQNSSGTYATINTTETTINGVVTPTTDGMAANKKYVDDSISGLSIPTKTSDLTNDSGFITSESDPVFTSSAAYGISSSDITNWNGKTSNTGTVTSIRVQATSPVTSSVNTAQSSSLDTTIALADGYGDTKNPYASKTKNYVLAAPSNANGVPGFRALVADDIPSLTKSKISDFPSLATVATSGSYEDLSNKPLTLPAVTTSDNGKVLRVVSGAWSAVELPSASGVSF